jgi:amidase
MEPFTSALDVAAAIRAREVSPVEVLEDCLERIDRLNPELNAVIWRDDDEARAAAKAAADAVVAGDALPPFHGVPIPIKDLTPVAGWPTTYGSHGAPDTPSLESELVVEAFVRAGFLLTGRTNTPEFGPITVTENVRYGVTRNPWDTGRTPGGSSGGAGAAVASGMFPLAHANDGGGSIRIPASCNGLVGLKVSRGRVPALYTAWEGAAVEGVVTRTVADTAAVLDVISGPERGAWWNAPAPERPFAEEVGADPGALRIGLVTAAPLGLPIDDACVEAARAAARALEEVGHVIDEPSFEVLPDEAIADFLNVVNATYADFPGVDWERVEPHNQRNRASAAGIDSLTYVASVHALQRLTRRYVAAWGRDFDVLLTPTMSLEPPPAGAVLSEAHDAEGPAETVLRMVLFTVVFNLTGQPAISLPVHQAPSGLPVGVQLVGGPWEDATVLRLAAQLEQAVPWADRRPAVG